MVSKKHQEQAVSAKGAPTEKTSESSPFALLFELESVAVRGRQATFDVLAGILKEQGVDITLVHFSRFCLDSHPAEYIPELLEALGAKKLSAEKLAEDVNSGLNMFLSSKNATMNRGLSTILEETASQGMPICAVSTLSEPSAQALMQRLDLDRFDSHLFNFNAAGHGFPRADAWLKMAKAMSKAPRNCLALVSSLASCRSALSASLRCVAIPDEFTSFQDYGGADAVLDSLEEVNVQDLMKMAFPASIIA